MKQGRSISELAAELERQAASKKDYIAPNAKLKMAIDPKEKDPIILQGVNGGMNLRAIAHTQLANSLQIPKPYYDRLVEQAPDLLAANVNRNMDLSLYLHRQCIPLEMVDLEAQAEKEAKKKPPNLFSLLDCDEGMCGV